MNVLSFAKKWIYASTIFIGLCTMSPARTKAAEDIAPIPVDVHHFPDQELRAQIAKSYDTNHDGSLSEDEITSVKELVFDEGISDFTGIDVFSEAESFSLDSFDPGLDDTGVYHTAISKLDLNVLPRLITVHFYYGGGDAHETPMTVDLSGLQHLVRVELFDDDSRRVNGENRTTADHYAYTSINLKNTPKLDYVSIHGAKNISIDEHADLKILRLSRVEQLPVPAIQSLDALEYLDLWSDNEELADLSLQQFKKLEHILIANHKLARINTTNLPQLLDANLSGEHLTSVDFTGCPKLEDLRLDNTKISSAVLDPDTRLRILSVFKTDIASFDWLDISSLTELDVSYTPFRTLSLKNAPKLKSLNAQHCSRLVSADLSENTALTDLFCTFANCKKLSSVKLPKALTAIREKSFANCKALKELSIPSTSLSKIAAGAFRGCTALKKLSFIQKKAPSAYEDSFTKVPSSFTVYVPKNGTGWQKLPWSDFTIVYGTKAESAAREAKETAAVKKILPKLSVGRVGKTGVYPELRWSLSSQPAMTKFFVYRSTSKNGTYKKVWTITKPSQTSAVLSAKSGKTYYFKLRGCRKIGKHMVYTKYSNTVSYTRP